MKNVIRAVIPTLASVCAMLLTYTIFNVVVAESSDSNLPDVEPLIGTPISEEFVQAELIIDDGTTSIISTPMHETSLITIGSIKMKTDSGWIDTNPVSIDIEALREAYNTEYPEYDWDVKNKINTIYLLYEFLVNQNNVSHNIACAMIGAIMDEGYLGQKQNSSYCLSNIDDVHAVLGNGSCGYGLAQWTFSTRQKALANYYDLASTMFTDWNDIQMVAECCMLLEEVKAYEVFSSMDEFISIEQATGRMCKIYESYKGVDSQWSKDYTLVTDYGTGKLRLTYAYAIHDLFKE